MSKDKESTEVLPKQKLKTLEDLAEAHEFVFNQQSSGKIDAKSADALNTTLKGAIMLKKLKLDAAKLVLQSKIKKIDMPTSMLEDLTTEMVAQAK